MVTKSSRSQRTGAASRPAEDVVDWRNLDIFDVDELTRAIQRVDVLVSSYHPRNSAKDPAHAIGRAIADPPTYARAVRSMLNALEGGPTTRLVVVCGGANLEIAPGQTTVEDEPRLREVLRTVGAPQEYVAAGRGHRKALRAKHLEQTPHDVHHDLAVQPVAARARVLAPAHATPIPSAYELPLWADVTRLMATHLGVNPGPERLTDISHASSFVPLVTQAIAFADYAGPAISRSFIGKDGSR